MKNKKFLILMVFFCVICILQVNGEVTFVSDKERFQYYIKEGFKYRTIKDFNNSNRYFINALNIVVKYEKGNERKIFFLIYYIGINFIELRQSEIALKYFKKGLKYKTYISKQNLFNLYLTIGNLEYNERFFDASLIFYEKAFYVLHKNNYKVRLECVKYIFESLNLFLLKVSKSKQEKIIKIFEIICNDEEVYYKYISKENIRKTIFKISVYYFNKKNYKITLQYLKRIENDKDFIDRLNYQEKVILFSVFGECYYQTGILEDSEKYFKRVLLICKRNNLKVNSRKFLLKTYLKLALIYNDLKKHNEGLVYLKKTLEHKKYLSKKDLICIYSLIGDIYFYSKRSYDLSLILYEKAFYILYENSNKITPKIIRRIIGQLSLIFLYASKDKLIKIIKIFKIICDNKKRYYQYVSKEDIINMILEISFFYLNRQNYKDSLKYFRKLEENKMYLDFLGSQKKGLIFSTIALLYKQLGEVKESIKYLQKFLLFTKNTNTILIKRDRAVAYLNLGKIYRSIGRYKQSIVFLKKAYNLVKDDNNGKLNLSQVLMSMAFTYVGLKDYKLATYAVNEILKKASEPLLIADANHLLGQLCYLNMKYLEAIKRLDKAKKRYIRYGDILNMIFIYNLKFQIYIKLRKFKEQLDCLNKALSLHEGNKHKFIFDFNYKWAIAHVYLGYAIYYENKQNLRKSITYILKAKKISYGNNLLLMKVVSNQVKAYFEIGDMTKLKDTIKELKFIGNSLKTDWSICKYNEIMGLLNLHLGELEKALKNFREIKEIDDNYHMIHNFIGKVYENWGSYNRAIYYYKKEEELLEKKTICNKGYLNAVYLNIVNTYLCQNNRKEAYKYFLKIKKLYTLKDLKNNIDALITIDKFEYKFMEKKRNKIYLLKKIKQYKKFLKNTREKKSIFTLWFVMKLADLYFLQNNFNEAIIYYQKSLKISQELKNNDYVMACKVRLGVINYMQGAYQKALKYLKETVEMIEKQRLTAKGLIRQQYFDRLSYIYDLIASIYLKKNMFNQVYHYLELSKAKTFSEDLLNISKPVLSPRIFDFQKTIESDIEVLMYGESYSNKSIKLLLGINSIFGIINKIDLRVILLDKKYFYEILKIRNITLNNRKKIISECSENMNLNVFSRIRVDFFTAVIYYYRYILENSKSQYLADLSSELYRYLIKDIKGYIKTNNLVITPDGALGHLPFETLIRKDKNGKKRYLIEDYKISYIQSAKTYVYLSKPKPEYEKNILAFGGVHYKDEKPKNKQSEKEKKEEDEASDQLCPRKRFVCNERYLRYISKEIRREGGEIPKSFRDKINSCENLLSTKKTLEVLKGYRKVQTYSGKDVTLKKLEELSKTGELEKYKIIHFGAHGIIFPSVPELSGIVISSNKEDKRPISNYLHFNRILKLKLKADLVVLAACQSGVGEITSEGLNGLTEAFMQAGARNVLVTLWSVYDEYTHIFMKKFYELHHKNPEWSYSKVLRAVKLMSIRGELGEKYKSPCFWGAYVLYGRD